MSDLATYSSPEHSELAQWLERQVADGATRIILRQKTEEGGDTLVREFPVDGDAGVNALADMLHRRAQEDGRHFRRRPFSRIAARGHPEYELRCTSLGSLLQSSRNLAV